MTLLLRPSLQTNATNTTKQKRHRIKNQSFWKFLLSMVITVVSLDSPKVVVTAFSTTLPSSASTTTKKFVSSSVPPTSSRLTAIVYGEDGTYSSLDNDENDDKSSSSSSSSSSSNLIGLISESESVKLARLAAAFAPPGHEIHPNDLEAAQVISIDDDHIEISAVTCDSEECITLFVPVEFPENCATYEEDAANEKCVIDNLHKLDDEALERIRKQEWKIDHKEELAIEEELWKSMQVAETFDELPDWWESPKDYYVSNKNILMIEECQSVKKLLNDDEFRDDVVALATKTCTEIYPLDTFELTHAAIPRVGPSGLMIKARIRLDDDDSKDDDILVIDLPVKFSSHVETVEELRASVLGTVVPV